MPLEKKYRCPECGYESVDPGLCPICEVDLEELCRCGSGEFSKDCCEREE